jgi:hypothetical protein
VKDIIAVENSNYDEMQSVPGTPFCSKSKNPLATVCLVMVVSSHFFFILFSYDSSIEHFFAAWHATPVRERQHADTARDENWSGRP